MGGRECSRWRWDLIVGGEVNVEMNFVQTFNPTSSNSAFLRFVLNNTEPTAYRLVRTRKRLG